jgi:hypothetical protein
MDYGHNFVLIIGRLHAFLPDKSIVIVSLMEDSTALIPIGELSPGMKDNLKMLSEGTVLGIRAQFVKSSSRFCRLRADRITSLSNKID